MADAAIHGHEDERSFFTRWFMSTNHKDIGILYLIVSAFAGLISVAFTVYMRLELMEPGVQYMCLEGARMFASSAECTPNGHLWNVLITGTRHPDDVLRRHPGPVRRFRQLLHAAADRCTGHGIPADEQPVLLALCRRHLAGRRFGSGTWWQRSGRFRRGLGSVSSVVDQ